VNIKVYIKLNVDLYDMVKYSLYDDTVMLGIGRGGRKRGRPRSRWIDGIAADTGMNFYQMVEADKDRKGWRSIVEAVARVHID